MTGDGWIVNEYDVRLDAAGQMRVRVMKVIREYVDVQLMVARDMLNALPCKLLDSVDKERAMALTNALREAGATVTVVCRPEEYPAGCWVGDVYLTPPSAGGCLGQCTEPHEGCVKEPA